MAASAHTPQFLLKLPSTRLGWSAVWVSAAFVVLFGLTITVLYPLAVALPGAAWQTAIGPYFSVAVVASGLGGGVLGLLALIFKRERSLLVWLTLLPFAVMVIFLLGEVLLPH